MKFIGILLILIGIVLGIYVGIYLLLYGGIVQVINNLNPVNASQIAIGIIRVLLCELGYVVFVFFWCLGIAFIKA